MGDIGPFPDGAIEYENTAELVWAEQAFQLWKRRELQVQAFDADGVVSVQVWGPCPRCGHPLNVQKTLTAAVSEVRGLWGTLTGGDRHVTTSTIPKMVEIGCDCESIHDGGPTGQHGCGVSFRLPTSQPPSSHPAPGGLPPAP
jgi:hypothetical protein